MNRTASADLALDLWVPGVPKPKGSKTALGRGRLIEAGTTKSRKALRLWRDTLHTELLTAAEFAGLAAIDEPVRLSLDFYLERPKSARPSRVWPHVKPDLDKLTRTVLDELEGPVVRNDSRVVDIEARKHYARSDGPGVLILVWRMGALEARIADDRRRLSPPPEEVD